MKRTAVERRALAAIQTARMMIPDYGTGRRPKGQEIDRLLAYSRIETIRTQQRTPAVLTPPFDGTRILFLSRVLPYQAAIYIELHECGHAIAGDADEPTILHFQGPIPEAEDVADLFALSAIISDADCEMGAEHVERRIRELAPIQDRGWEQYRVAALTPRIMRLRSLIKEWL